MFVVAIASQKGGAGKSTFAVNLATLADQEGKRALLIDTDEQGSLSAWRRLRRNRTPLLFPCRADELPEVLATVERQGGVEWVFVDCPPASNNDIAAIMGAATLVLIPTRPALFDLAAVPSTIAMARRVQRPFFVALNAVPPKRGIAESPIVNATRKAIRDMGAPVWRGTVAHRAAHAHALASGLAVTEFESAGPAADEMRLLWNDVSEATRAMAGYRQRAV